MQVELLLFGAFGDVMREGPRDVSQGVTAGELAKDLMQENPAFAALYAKKGSRMAVNQAIAHADILLADGDVIAFLAPVSGG